MSCSICLSEIIWMEVWIVGKYLGYKFSFEVFRFAKWWIVPFFELLGSMDVDSCYRLIG